VRTESSFRFLSDSLVSHSAETGQGRNGIFFPQGRWQGADGPLPRSVTASIRSAGLRCRCSLLVALVEDLDGATTSSHLQASQAASMARVAFMVS
jgi:hypothetical protein